MRRLYVPVRLAATALAVAAAAGCMSVGDGASGGDAGPSRSAGEQGGKEPDGGSHVPGGAGYGAAAADGAHGEGGKGKGKGRARAGRATARARAGRRTAGAGRPRPPRRRRTTAGRRRRRTNRPGRLRRARWRRSPRTRPGRALPDQGAARPTTPDPTPAEPSSSAHEPPGRSWRSVSRPGGGRAGLGDPGLRDTGSAKGTGCRRRRGSRPTGTPAQGDTPWRTAARLRRRRAGLCRSLTGTGRGSRGPRSGRFAFWGGGAYGGRSFDPICPAPTQSAPCGAYSPLPWWTASRRSFCESRITELTGACRRDSGRFRIRMSITSTDHVVVPEAVETAAEGASETAQAPRSPSRTSACPRASCASSRRTA